MKFRIVKLKASGDEIVDIPEECIPIEYNIRYTERSGPPANPLHAAIFGNNTFIETEREVTVLQLVVDKKDGEDMCFFCEKETTTDKIGIRPICAKCLTEIYTKAKESHKSSDC